MFKNKKPIFVVVLVILVISIFFALSNFDDKGIKNHAKLLVDNNEQFIQIEKSKSYYEADMTMNFKELTDDNVEQINQNLKRMGKTGRNIYRLVALHIKSNDIMADAIGINELLQINPEYQDFSNPYTYWCSEFDIVEWDDFKDFFISDITGRVPANNNEIMISNHLADLLLKAGLKLYEEDNYYKPKSYEELVKSNKYFYFGRADKVKIVGIINYDLSEFEELKVISWDEFNSDYAKYSPLSQKLSYETKNIHNKIFVNNEFIDNLNVNNESTLGTIWQNKIIRTGILVVENTKKGFLKLLREFRSDEPITAKSTYSEFLDITKETDSNK